MDARMVMITNNGERPNLMIINEGQWWSIVDSANIGYAIATKYNDTGKSKL